MSLSEDSTTMSLSGVGGSLSENNVQGVFCFIGVTVLEALAEVIQSFGFSGVDGSFSEDKMMISSITHWPTCIPKNVLVINKLYS